MPQLAAMVRAKYPGVYDDLDDATLERQVRAKFPGVYDDLAEPSSKASPPAAQASPAPSRAGYYQGAAEVMGDLAVGAAKGVGQTVTGLGRAVQAIPGAKRAVDAIYGTPGLSANAMNEADRVLTPSNTTQAIGKGAEQIAEVVVPGRMITAAGTKIAGKLAPMVGNLAPRMAIEAASNAAIAGVQGGDPMTAGVLGAAGPVIGKALGGVGGMLRESAKKNVEQALGATKEHYKALGKRLAPEILKRGIRGSREGLAEKAGAAAEAAGDEIDQALQAFGHRGADVRPVVDAIERAKDAFRTQSATGQIVVFEPRAVKQLDGLQAIVRDLGPQARIDQLVAVRRSWDKVVADAGGFSHRAPGGIGRPLKDISEASTKREATTAIRQLLNVEVPELTALNKEYAFWKGLDDVVTQTLQRKSPQGASLGGAVKEAGAQAAGAAATGSLGAAFALGKVANLANAVFQSPRWKLASAQTKDALATAIVNGEAGRIATILSRIGATQGSKLVPASAGGF